MSDETAKAKLVLSVLKGDLTLDDVCSREAVSRQDFLYWIDEASASVGSLSLIYEKLRKIKRRVNMFVMPGGSLACIRFHDNKTLLGDKSDYFCSSVPLADLGDGEVILNYSRSSCKLEEIDIVLSHLCLPERFVGSGEEVTEYQVEIELDFKYRTAKIRFSRPDKIQFQCAPNCSIFFTVPPPLRASVQLGVNNTSARLNYIEITHADQCLPERFFAADKFYD